MPSLTRWAKAQRFRAPANAPAPPANQHAGKGSPLRYVNRRAWESRLVLGMPVAPEDTNARVWRRPSRDAMPARTWELDARKVASAIVRAMVAYGITAIARGPRRVLVPRSRCRAGRDCRRIACGRRGSRCRVRRRTRGSERVPLGGMPGVALRARRALVGVVYPAGVPDASRHVRLVRRSQWCASGGPPGLRPRQRQSIRSGAPRGCRPGEMARRSAALL